MEDLTPMMRQYHEIKRAHPGKLVFFRLGDFYELFYEDALIASRELELTLTSRNRDGGGRPIPMCGVPYHAVDGYLARLLKKGYKVAICEQVEDPRRAKKLVKREVIRVVTPGTVVEEVLLDPKENNYIASVYLDGGGDIGAAFLDVSTGDFKITEFRGPGAWERFEEEAARFQPRELIYPEGETRPAAGESSAEALERALRTPLEAWAFNFDYARRILLEQLGAETLDGYGCEGKPLAVAAAGALLHYVREMHRSQLGHVASLSCFESSDYLKLDPATVANLELLRAADGSSEPSLLSTIDFTRTRMGRRLLKSWLQAPITNLEELGHRLDAVEELKASAAQREQMGKLLAGILDLERLISKATVGTANARDLVAFKNSIANLPAIKSFLGRFSSAKLSRFAVELDELVDLRQLLQESLAEDPPAALNEGGLIKPGYSRELDELRSIARDGKAYLAQLEARERKRTGINSLKVRFNQVFGYFIEVTKPNLHLVPPDYIRKQTLAGVERFFTEELKEYEEKVLGAEERMAELEYEIFSAIRQKLAGEAQRVMAVARSIAELDVLLSFAEAAARYHYCRPRLDSSDEIYIKNGRHPVIERCVSPFIPNDAYMNTTTDQLLIVTGPNMGGKSTYLRQVALIVIMAQAGCFVPASEARIGLVDQIFTRVGASDNLARGRSTFMQEMIETAKILNTATRRSLILLDEVGRGTATFDGLSIAWAVAEYLHDSEERRAKTLFATHYHELTKLAATRRGVKNYCVAVKESAGRIVFLRKVVPGAADKSYGIEVARLAGLPPQVIERARRVLAQLERKEIDLTTTKDGAARTPDNMQKSLFGKE